MGSHLLTPLVLFFVFYEENFLMEKFEGRLLVCLFSEEEWNTRGETRRVIFRINVQGQSCQSKFD